MLEVLSDIQLIQPCVDFIINYYKIKNVGLKQGNRIDIIAEKELKNL